MHVMLDLETLGTTPSAKIVQIAAVAFEFRGGGRVHTGMAFNMHVDPDSQPWGFAGRDTLRWWLQQGEDARTALSDGLEPGRCVSILEALQALAQWPEKNFNVGWDVVEGLWAKPATFDIPLLAHAYSMIGCPETPWPFWIARDVRSFALGIAGETDLPKPHVGGTEHHALDDCVNQVSQLQTLLTRAGK